jgi:N-ethylmaleimide reductase
MMVPLTRNRAGQGQVPQAMNVRYYQQRALASLIICEAAQVCPEGVGYPNTHGIHSAEQVKGWCTITEAVHKQGGHHHGWTDAFYCKVGLHCLKMNQNARER